MLNPCHECGHALWSEVRRTGFFRFAVFFDDDERSDTYVRAARPTGGVLMAAPLFELGLVVATPEALALAKAGAFDPAELLERHQQGDWGNLHEHSGEGALDQPVTPLEPVDRRVEHRREEERYDEPADESAHLPEHKERAQHHRRTQEGCDHRAHHLQGRDAHPHHARSGHGGVGLRRSPL